MYKPNGEEPMTKQEEIRRRQAVAENAKMRAREELSTEALRAAFYSVIFRSTTMSEESVEAVMSRAR
jgi:hypothetical protein